MCYKVFRSGGALGLNLVVEKVRNILCKRCAFTLAEVLITLGIIGIVAAMTMPTLLANHQKVVLEKQFKVAYSLVAQAVDSMSEDNIDIVGKYCGYNIYEQRNMIQFGADFAKYFQNVKLGNFTDNELFRLGYKSRFYMPAKGKNEEFNYYLFVGGRYIIFNNGMILITPSNCVRIGGTLANGGTPRPVGFVIDINGTKGPNRLGYDIFDFQILKGNRLSASSYAYAKTQVERTGKECCNFKSNSACFGSGNGLSCTYFAVMDEAPDDSTKSYWKNLP